MRTTLYLTTIALLGACVDSATSPPPDEPTSPPSQQDGTAAPTTVDVTIAGNPVLLMYRDGVNGPWLTPTKVSPDGISYSLSVHAEYELVAVCLDPPPFAGFDAETLAATARDGGQAMTCGFSTVTIGGGGGGGGPPPPPPVIAGTVVQPGEVEIGLSFSDFNFAGSADWQFQDNFLTATAFAQHQDVIADDGSNVALIRNVKVPGAGVTKNLGTIDIDNQGAAFAVYAPTTSALDGDETASTFVIYQTGNGTQLRTFSPFGTVAAPVMPPQLVATGDLQES